MSKDKNKKQPKLSLKERRKLKETKRNSKNKDIGIL